MSSQTISPARLEQLNTVVKNFLSAFDKPIGPDQTREQFTAIFSSEIQWRDHAFLVCRAGHEAVLGLHKAWLHCNQPFTTNIKVGHQASRSSKGKGNAHHLSQAIHPTPSGCVLEQVWVGRQANDIVRPDGQVAVKASGNDFVCHVCMVMQIDAAGKIERIDEYYNKRWDEGVGEDRYVVIKGASLRSHV